MSDPIRVGIIGMGGFAAAHHLAVEQLETAGHARLVATCDPRLADFAAEQQAWDFARRGVRVFTDYREMLDACADQLDLLVVPTPIPLHAEMHAAAVERGIPVYLEKPPTLDHDELERMIATDRHAAKATLVGFNFIIEQPRLALKRRLLDGEFGPLREARLVARWPRPASYFARNSWAGRLQTDDGRIVLDSCFGNAMAHFVHNLLFWGGVGAVFSWARLAQVQAEVYRAHAIEGADTFFVSARTADDVTLRFALTHACTGESIQTETLVCEHATLRYHIRDDTEIHWHDGRVERIRMAPFDALRENHLAYYAYLRGQADRPATRLVDCRPFVALNNLAFVSSGTIRRFLPRRLEVDRDARDQKDYLHVRGLPEALDAFAEQGIWPADFGGPDEPARIAVTPGDLNRFHALVPRLRAAAPAR